MHQYSIPRIVNELKSDLLIRLFSLIMTFNVQLWKWLSISVDVFPHRYMHPSKQRDGEKGSGIVGGVGVRCGAVPRNLIVTARSSPVQHQQFHTIYIYIYIHMYMQGSSILANELTLSFLCKMWIYVMALEVDRLDVS